MFIRVGYEMAFELPERTPMLVMLSIHPSRQADLVTPDRLHTEPYLPLQEYKDTLGNRVHRFVAPAGSLRLWSDAVVQDRGVAESWPIEAVQHPVEDLPVEVLQFLLGSRYCEVQQLSEFAWSKFGELGPGWPRVHAVLEWTHRHITFGYEHASPTKTALDVFHNPRGVCRDYQHLAIALCRCLNIPARYATGFLGEHGVPPQPDPMDFSAWYEVFLGGRWWPLDARNYEPRIGRILMATGRDATDVALTTSFGAAEVTSFHVWSDEIRSPEDTRLPVRTLGRTPAAA